ncbi:MAG TPA: hypothetical protein ACHBZ9_01260, partial [Arsenophonus nasoniae]|uniref:gp53-like domain-containing protein n=1 Tax=Arsenophonus nasoniae TaxID=638 RepID=UPI00387A2667
SGVGLEYRVQVPKSNGTLALTNNPTKIAAPVFQVKSPSTHAYIELIAANGNTWRIGSNNNDQRSYFEKVGKFSIYFPEKAGTLALISDVETRGAKNTANNKNNGYWRCGDTGIIIQAATYKTSGNGTKTFNFPIPFPSQCMSAVASVNGISNDPDYYCFYVRAKNNQYITTYCEGIGMTDINILAMGY